MTISTAQSQTVIPGDSVNTVFAFNFIGDSTSNIEVIYTNSSGVATTLLSTQYSLFLNPAAPGQLWGVGGTVTYPLSGTPMPFGASLTIQRILPFTQETGLSGQGNFSPEVVEEALDILCMELQQVAGRTGQQRGTWVSGAFYNFGDVTQDGVNGGNSGNYYLAAAANTSGVWATDLANGYWTLVIQSTIPSAPLPLSVANGGTGASTANAALNNLGGISLSGDNAFSGDNTYSGSNDYTSGSIAVPTAGDGDSSTKAASTDFVNSTPLTLTDGTTAATQAGGDNSTLVATTAQVRASINASAPYGTSLVLISTQTASAIASISFTGIPSGYDQYVLLFTNVVPATNGAKLLLQVGNPGIVSANYSWGVMGANDVGASGSHGNASDTSFAMTFNGISNVSTIGVSGEITFSGLSSASGQTMVRAQYLYFDGTNTLIDSFGGRQGGTGGPFTVIKALMSSGNIASGTFSLYAVRKS